MLLRRVIEHVKAQNWTAVALDFVIVVVGVLIALQLSTWNAAREDRDAEARYLANLARDLTSDIEELRSVRDLNARNIAILNINLVRGFSVDPDGLGPSPPFDLAALPEFGTADWRAISGGAGAVRDFDPSSKTFDMLVSTGDVSLLRNHDLVQQLLAYRKAVDELEDFETNTGRFAASLVPGLVEFGFALGEPVDFKALAEANEDDPRILATLLSWRNLTRSGYARRTQLLAMADETLALIEAERD